MGREVRMVPKDWQHPVRSDKVDAYGPDYIALNEGPWEVRAATWDDDNAHWQKGEERHWGFDKEPDTWVSVQAQRKIDYPTYEEWAGERPRSEDYMPTWTPEEATWYMMYESTSEGTPLSPAFETPEELARWLADNRASTFADMTATYDQWLPTCRGGYAPSAVFEPGVGMVSGVVSAAEWVKDKV